jgi:hypothetical protein
MVAKFELTSVPLGLVPFLLKRRALPAPIRFLLRDNLPQLPEHVRIERSVKGLAENWTEPADSPNAVTG